MPKDECAYGIRHDSYRLGIPRLASRGHTCIGQKRTELKINLHSKEMRKSCYNSLYFS